MNKCFLNMNHAQRQFYLSNTGFNQIKFVLALFLKGLFIALKFAQKSLKPFLEPPSFLDAHDNNKVDVLNELPHLLSAQFSLFTFLRWVLHNFKHVLNILLLLDLLCLFKYFLFLRLYLLTILVHNHFWYLEIHIFLILRPRPELKAV